MVKRFSFDGSDDSQELQSLFDSIAAQASTPAPARPHLAAVGSAATATGDSDELEALFDSISDQYQPPAAQAASPHEERGRDAVFNRIGHMTRKLHDTLRELGYDRSLQEAAKAIPDARQRLVYIAQMTEQAASRVLNATDVAKPIQDDLRTRSSALGQRWNRLFSGNLSVDEFKSLADDTRAFLEEVPKQASATSAHLMEIMMAQDFQDLTGQVIKKIVDLAQNLEQLLLQVLIEAMPDDKRIEAPTGLLNGPAINAEGRSDVATTQEQVDDLLESLGF